LDEASRWREVDRLFESALDLPAAERPAFLDRECAGDPDLRGEVERLLAADGEGGAEFLERSPIELLEWALQGEESGDDARLGAYRLLRRLQTGGMGTVYLAARADQHYERHVAVKILRAGLVGTEALHRFRAERQILAQLEHPNIARLYDGGETDDGRPYLVLELVEGLPLDVYCDQHQLSLEARLELFKKICGAVQYAHQNLLVHRDLKPANILVTAEGEPKLLDFGIAKQLEPADADDPKLTRTGLRVMTPSYASPEQIRGEPITTASDVYALGVLLYDLLAGRSPYRVESGLLHEIETAICEDEPEKPSRAVGEAGDPVAEALARARSLHPRALRRRLQGDLDNIVLMALRKEPQRRYGSAAALAADIENYLNNLPVVARPDTFGYRTGKFMRRQRVGVATAVAVLVLAVAFVVSLIAQGRRLAQERDKARYALSFLVDTFKGANPYETGGESLTAKDILDRGAERVARELKGQPDVQAALMDAIGKVNSDLSRLDRAEPLLTQALALRQRVFGTGSLEVAESLDHLARVRYARSDFAEAQRLARRALAIKRRELPAGDVEIAKALNLYGVMLYVKGTSPEAEKGFQEALEIAEKAEGPRGKTVANSLIFLARSAQDRKDFTAAERLYRRGLAIQEKVLGEHDPEYVSNLGTLSTILQDLGKLHEEEELLRRVLALQEKMIGRDNADVGITISNLGSCLRILGRYAEAEPLFRETMAIWSKHYGAQSSVVTLAAGNLAGDLLEQGRAQEAMALDERYLPRRREVYGEKHLHVGSSYLRLALARLALGQPAEALALAQKSLAVVRAAAGETHPKTAQSWRALGQILLAQGKAREAEPPLRRSVEIQRQTLPASHPELARSQAALAACLEALGKQGEAKELLAAASATLALQFGPQHPETLALTARLARLAGTAPHPASPPAAAAPGAPTGSQPGPP
jgi:serine/threonine-protein kinase